MLFVIATVGGFVYINMYLTFDLYNVVIAQTGGTEGPTPSNCMDYYCGYSAHYYVHNHAAYSKCNQYMCSPLCTAFPCSSPPIDNLPYYYDCYTSCSGYPMVTNKEFPTYLLVTFYVASVGGCIFGVAVLISLVYGLAAQCTSSGLNCGERLALLVNFVCPSAKYYALREREDWTEVKVNLRAMLWVDIVVTAMVAMALGSYIFLAIARAFLFYEYLVTYGMALMLLAYAGNLHRNFAELSDFYGRLEAIRAKGA